MNYSRSVGLPEPSGLKSVEGFPCAEEVAHGQLFALSLSNRTNGLTHGMHRFPAKFIPQIPRWAIEQYSSPGHTVLDPFCGSGTTLVEATATNRVGLGYDVDPLSVMISSAKTTVLDPVRLRGLSEILLAYRPSVDGLYDTILSGIRNFQRWFPSQTICHLNGVCRTIESLDCTPAERVWFRTVFSSIIRWVSNADDQTQKTYISGTSQKTPPSVDYTLRRALTRAAAGMSTLATEADKRFAARSAVGSAISLPPSTASVELIVTSPPYLDSVDYMYNCMLEYFWLGRTLGLSARSDFNALRRAQIGSKNPEHSSELPLVLRGLVNVHEIPSYRQSAVLNYFSMMAEHFAEARRVLRKDGTYVLVIGNSQTEGGVVPVHDCLIRLAHEAGLIMHKAFAYRIRRHYMKFPRKGRGGIILMDWVVVLKAATGQSEIPGRLPMPIVTIAPHDVAH